MKPNQPVERVLLIESEVRMCGMFSPDFLKDLTQAIDAALSRHGIVNVPLLAEQVRRRNEHENIALEDVEAKIMQLAQYARRSWNSKRLRWNLNAAAADVVRPLLTVECCRASFRNFQVAVPEVSNPG